MIYDFPIEMSLCFSFRNDKWDIPFGVPFDIPYRENWDIPLKMITYNFEMIKNDCHFEMKSHRLIIERRFLRLRRSGCFVCNTDKR